MRAGSAAAAGLAALAVAGCGGSDGSEKKATTTGPQGTPSATADTALVRCLKGQTFITVKPGPGGVQIATTREGERAIIRTYDSLSDALRAGHAKHLDLDQVISRQTIEYAKPGTGQIKIAVETCQ
jgi:hypothetical protein